MKRVVRVEEKRGRLKVWVKEDGCTFFRSLPVRDFYLVSEVQRLFRIKDEHVVYRWIWEGKLKAFKEGKILRIPYSSLIEFIKERVF